LHPFEALRIAVSDSSSISNRCPQGVLKTASLALIPLINNK